GPADPLPHRTARRGRRRPGTRRGPALLRAARDVGGEPLRGAPWTRYRGHAPRARGGGGSAAPGGVRGAEWAGRRPSAAGRGGGEPIRKGPRARTVPASRGPGPRPRVSAARSGAAVPL